MAIRDAHARKTGGAGSARRTAVRTNSACRAPPQAGLTTVLLAEDHDVVRQGLRALLAAERGIAVVGEARDGRQAVKLACSLRPDVVVMDVTMPRLNGLEATRQIVAAAPATRVVVLSAHCDETYVERASQVGAAAYLLKRSPLRDLLRVIRGSKAGTPYEAPSVAQRLRGPDAEPSSRSAGPAAEVPRLTQREAEVLQGIVEGRANKQTAAELGISVRTVEKHRQSLMAKLDIHDVAGLTHYAIARGIVECAGRPPDA